MCNPVLLHHSVHNHTAQTQCCFPETDRLTVISVGVSMNIEEYRVSILFNKYNPPTQEHI